MLKKHQKMTKIKQKNAILMSEKISVTPINKEFSQKYGVKVEYPSKQGLNYSLKTTTFIQGCFFICKKRFKYFTLSNF